jgi:hypothetical protein
MNRSRTWGGVVVVVVVVVIALGALGCAESIYELQPVPRAGDGTPPVKAQVRRVSWLGQPESGGLGEGAQLGVEVDLYVADATRVFVVDPVRVEARPALGGPALVLTSAGDATPGPMTLQPHEARTIWATFDLPDIDPPRGPQRLVVIVPVQGQPSLELAVADPVAGGPRWPAGRVAGAYFFSALAFAGSPRLSVMEPLGFAARLARERWVLGLGASYTFLYQEALAGGPPAHGVSLHAQVTWQPWTSRFAPYVEVGTFTGIQAPPPAYSMSARTLELPRVSAGVLLSLGKRLGEAGPLPFEHVLSPQRELGLRLGYTRWFNTGEHGGSGGLELSVERGFGP